MSEYYDGTKLLSLKDINGDTPEIYICTSNRSAGKTTYFSRLLVNKFLKNGEKFCLIYRYKYELSGVAEKFFKDINGLFFQGCIMESEPRAKGVFHELFITRPYAEKKEGCGYAISLNCADQLKKYSHLLSDVSRFMFDEFQSENNMYCSQELRKFISLHVSISRGNGEQSRYVPVYMVSNPVSIINPYYVELGISQRLSSNTKFLKGEGFVLEQGYNESASKAQESSAFNRAFGQSDYMAYNTQAVYLNDNKAFIEKPEGRNKYLGTIKYENKHYGLREFPDEGVVYCDNRPDMTYPFKISITTDDHNINYVMLRNNDVFISNIRWYFEKGCVRFKDLSCKECVLKLISY